MWCYNTIKDSLSHYCRNERIVIFIKMSPFSLSHTHTHFDPIPPFLLSDIGPGVLHADVLSNSACREGLGLKTDQLFTGLWWKRYHQVPWYLWWLSASFKTDLKLVSIKWPTDWVTISSQDSPKLKTTSVDTIITDKSSW